MGQQTETTAKLDTGELANGWSKKKGRKPKFFLQTRVSARTDLGRVRENNEDKFEFCEPEEPEILAAKGYFYAVADGMGGHASGQIASELALKQIIRSYYRDPAGDVEDSLRQAFQSANSYIYDAAIAVPERNGMGTTCTVAVLRDDYMYAAHVGDSRLYLVRDESIRRVTEDHSWVEEQVKRGALTREEAEMSPFRNVITRSLGAAPDVEVDICREKVRKGDVLVLCSDGLSAYVSDGEILELVSSWSPGMATLKLIDRANEAGGGDNITVLIVAIRDIQKARGRGRLPKLLRK
jgi:protein phosphatase